MKLQKGQYIATVRIPDSGTYTLILDENDICVFAAGHLDFALNQPRTHLGEFFKTMGWHATIKRPDCLPRKKMEFEVMGSTEQMLQNISEAYVKRQETNEQLTQAEIKHQKVVQMRLNAIRIRENSV